MKERFLFCLFLSSLVTAGFVARDSAVAASKNPTLDRVDFSRDIRPILSDNCFACHGPDEGQRQARLRLDTKQGAFADRGGYRVIVARDAAASRLYQRISHERGIVRMPPPGFERRPTQEQIELIRRWIDQGAEWETHWAFRTPIRPALPKVTNEAWPRNPIDYFVLARLEQEGLEPSQQADKARLLRRVSFDLTGLPPTPDEVEAFLADDSPGAYGKVVDRLLRSARYGERMAMPWLDLARYADSHGYNIDSLREMWPWRDWVIDAFNRNMPFDQFTMEQIAGDLLPNATREQKVATGFNRNHMINFEGGAVPEEYQTEYVVDRVETAATVWLGLTMGCARCHDHKYDPIKQKEFYRFFAFFNTITERGLDGRLGNAKPFVRLASPEQQQRLDGIQQQTSALEEAMPLEEVDRWVAEWRKTALSEIPAATTKGLGAHYEFDGQLADTSGHHKRGEVPRGELAYAEGPAGTGAVFDGETHIRLGVPALRRDRPFSVAVWIAGTGEGDLIPADRLLTVLEKVDAAQGRRGFELLAGESRREPPFDLKFRLYVRLRSHRPDDAIEVRTQEGVIAGKFGSHLTLAYDGSGKASGLKLYFDGIPRELEVIQDSLSGPITNRMPLEIGNKQSGNPYQGALDELRVYDRVLTEAEIRQLRLHEPMRAVASSPIEGCPEIVKAYDEKEAADIDQVEDKNNEQYDQTVEGRRRKACLSRRERLRDYYLTHAASPEHQRLYAKLKELEAKKEKLESLIPTSMIMEEMKRPRETFVLRRGSYSDKTEKVTASVPAVLSPMPKGAPRNRLGLAQWLVHPSHPLTARVTVNRYWQMHFGAGIVRSSGNFGSQGEPPTHPELLDWLATEFVRIGWDVKAIQRLTVTSATYRQASEVTAALLERDPENRLLARGPRFRLPAEMVRDNALAISGLLIDEVGGPSVYPYQPKSLWRELAYGFQFSGQEYDPGRGKDLHRRSLYTVWKRTVPPPSLATFDAPDREECISRRSRTNTPLQALVLMNDPTYVEAARALAERMILEAGREPAGRVRHAYRLAVAREPSAEELDVLLNLAERQQEGYRGDKPAARALLDVGESEPDPTIPVAELAAWTTVAGTVLSLRETITKE